MDGAHTEDGIKQVLMQVEQRSMRNGQWTIGNEQKKHFVIGMVKDKEVSKVLELLPDDAMYYFTNAHIPRALPAAELQQKASEYNLSGEIFDNVNEAISSAKKNAAKNDMIIVCGSVFLVGEVDV